MPDRCKIQTEMFLEPLGKFFFSSFSCEKVSCWGITRFGSKRDGLLSYQNLSFLMRLVKMPHTKGVC